MTIAPTLETERLVLRMHRIEDFAAYSDVLATQHSQYMGGPFTESRAWDQFCKDIAPWSLVGHGAFAVDEKSTNQLLGQISLSGNPQFPEKELGWLIFPDAAGKGIGYEAARAVRDWVYESLGFKTLVSYIHSQNSASIALAKKMRAWLDPSAPACPYDNHVVYRHPGPEESS